MHWHLNTVDSHNKLKDIELICTESGEQLSVTDGEDDFERK